MVIKLEFEIEDLIGARLLVEDKDGDLEEVVIYEVRGDLIRFEDGEWIKEADLNVKTILFRS